MRRSQASLTLTSSRAALYHTNIKVLDQFVAGPPTRTSCDWFGLGPTDPGRVSFSPHRRLRLAEIA